jgi:hypothetical protein
MPPENSTRRTGKRVRVIESLSTVHALRRSNLIVLAETFESIVAFSLKIQQAPSVYYAIAGNKAYKNMGEGLARSIEMHLGLPDRWLDKAH